MEKLICSKCGGTKWTEGRHFMYTVLPAIHAQEYICSECGNIHTVETREKPTFKKPKEVYVPASENQTQSSVSSDTTTTFVGHGTVTSISAGTDNQPVWTATSVTNMGNKK